MFAFRAPSSTGFRRAASSVEVSTISAPPAARLRPECGRWPGKIECSGCTVHEAGGRAAGALVSSAVSRQSAHYPAFSSSAA